METVYALIKYVEEMQEAEISVEDYMLYISFRKDLNSVTDDVQLIKEKIDDMMKTKRQIRTQILEKMRKTVSLESDSATLNQSLELTHQERESLSPNPVNRRMHYSKVTEDITSQLKDQQGSERVLQKPHETEDSEIVMPTSLKDKLDAAKLRFVNLTEIMSELKLDCDKAKKSLERVSCRISECKPELSEADAKFLEKEYQALLSNKNAETEYMQLQQLQISELMDMSNSLKCRCCEQEIKFDKKDAPEKMK